MVGTSGFELPENLLQSAADYLQLHYQPEDTEFLEAAKIRKASRKPRADFVGSLPEPRGVEVSRPSCAPGVAPAGVPENLQSPLEKAVSHLGESFQQRLLRMIDERGLSDAEVYRRADIDRKLFSKIRCNEDYKPRKRTILSLVIALHLDLDTARDLLGSAGYALADSSKTDVIISFCLENAVYDIMEVNALLDHFGEPTLS